MEKNIELVKRVLAGDNGAFREIVREYQRLVNHIVYRMVPDEWDREDICQDVFVKVYRNLDKFRGESRLSTWIGRIAANRCIDFLQAKKLKIDPTPIEETITLADESNPGPETASVQRNLTEILKKEIETIPNPYRTVLTLFHLDELTYEEIGSVLDMPGGTVKSYLFRARKKLRERLSSRYSIEELML